MDADRPRIVSHWFGPAGGPYERMARVLELSARRNCPGWQIEVRRVEPVDRRSSREPTYTTNTAKMDAWAGIVAEAPEAARILLLDADTFILRPLEDLWAKPFDLAITTKPSHFPFNTGVVAVRVTPALRAFVAVWQAENVLMLEEPRRHLPYRARYGGINQAALGAVLERGLHRELGLEVCTLSCAHWNSEETSWEAFGPDTRIVHVKSGLRKAALGMGVTSARVRPLVRAWRALDREATAAAGGAA